jgi:Nucleoside permease
MLYKNGGLDMKLILNLLGIVLILVICWLISWDRKNIKWKIVIKALIAEIIIALIIVKVPIGQKIITIMSNGLTAVINCGNEGLSFVFGDLFSGNLSIFIIQSLGNIIFVSALVGVLYYLGVIGFVVKWIGKAVGKIMGTTEVESFVAVANMFLGHTDSPILVSKYLKDLTDSEIFVILVSGMGSMSASILGGYHALGIPMEYLLIASAMVPIGSIMLSKIVSPQTEEAKSITDVKMDNKGNNSNVIDALAEGASTGMQMVISIGASIVGFVGIVAVINLFLGFFNITLSDIFSYVFAPFGFLLGLDGNNILMEGSLLGNKLILNEFVAFQDLGNTLGSLDARTGMICAISLCGFANLSSMGMCIGGIGVLCPEKRGTISRLVFKSMISGVFVSIMSALIVSIVSLF